MAVGLAVSKIDKDKGQREGVCLGEVCAFRVLLVFNVITLDTNLCNNDILLDIVGLCLCFGN